MMNQITGRSLFTGKTITISWEDTMPDVDVESQRAPAESEPANSEPQTWWNWILYYFGLWP